MLFTAYQALSTDGLVALVLVNEPTGTYFSVQPAAALMLPGRSRLMNDIENNLE